MILYPRPGRLVDSQHMGIYEAYAKNRILFLNGPIMLSYNVASSTIVLADTIMALAMQSDDPIWLFIDTPGGYVDAGLTLYDAMQVAPAPIYTVGRRCYSMGAILLTAGEPGHRYMMPHAKTMIHQPRGGVEGDVKDQEIGLSESRKVMQILVDLIVKHSGATKRKVTRDIDKEFWMNAEETIDYGLADMVFDSSMIKQFKQD